MLCYKCNTSKLINIILVRLISLSISRANDIFQQDLSDQMEIGLADKGYNHVELRCNSDSMVVDIETENDFSGVIYTRGSFYDREYPCFYDAEESKGQRSFQLSFPLDKCKIKRDGDVYSNVLVLQHDKELIMPGDAAFNLECDFSQEQDITVKSSLYKYNETPVISRITLTDADPSQKVGKDQKHTVESYVSSVIISPQILRRQRKEEL